MKTTDNKLAEKDPRFYESPLKQVFNKTTVFLLKALSRMPFWILYAISDFLYIWIRYILRYRRKVIYDNLRHAFPEKGKVEIDAIAREYYRHLCDMMLETVKLYTISGKELDKRIKFNGLERAGRHFKEGKSIVLLGMHYNNWEWSSTGQRKALHQLVMIYDPVRGNHAFEKFILDIRDRWGGKSIPVHKSARLAVEFSRMEKPVALWLAADQAAPANSRFWTVFLNREAPFFSGPEKIAWHSNQPVYFHHTRKISRGHYEVDFIPLFENPKEMESRDILLGYIHKMEELIREEPAYYLWSHRRWKHMRPENVPLMI